jgi:cytoskeletal protein CcmA (bactofilin family)
MFGRENEGAQTDETRASSVGSLAAGLDRQSQQANFLNTPNSVMGSDLIIIARDLVIICQSTLRLNGETTGEVRATEIVVGKSGKVTGGIAAETIVIDGEVHGTIRAPSVSLTATARVQGEIHHCSLEIERGAVFHGQSFHDPEVTNLMPKLDVA